MSASDSSNTTPKKSFTPGARKSVRISQEQLVTTGLLDPSNELPVLITPAVDGVDLTTWASNNREAIENHMLKNGGILFRNFGIASTDAFQQFINVFGDPLEYTYRSTPRSQVSGNIYTSTEYPANQSIPFHNEMSYSTTWPLRLWFCCLLNAQTGGETPIADSRKVYELIDPAIREKFGQKNVMYVRNYGEGLDLSWQNVFQTDDRAQVEAFCQESGIEWEWKDGDRLRTRQICQALARHPKTGEMLWFNQAHLFHVSSLPENVRDMLLANFDESELPRNTYYGDGSPIEPETLDAIRATYAEAEVKFPWQEGDVLMLDNMLVAHARTPFSGPRKIVVGMSDAWSDAGV